MVFVSDLSGSDEYKSFRSSVPLKRILVGDQASAWQVYDSGPRDSRIPLVCLPPISGSADVFFLQCLALSAQGYRVLSVEGPPLWTAEEWCSGFKDLLDHLALEKVHLFGAALGGFLAQKFAEVTRDCPRVASLILCNTFIDTAIFNFSDEATSIWMLPALVLRRMVLTGLNIGGGSDPEMEDAKEFIYEGLK